MQQAEIDRLQQAFIEAAARGRALHIGAGRKRIEGAVNLDADPDRARWLDLLADGQRLPFRDGAFDSVVSSHVIEHLARPVGALRDMVRVLRIGGYMVHIIPDARFTPHRRLTSRFPFAGHRNEWVPADFREIAAQVGGIEVVSLREFKGTRWSFEFIALRIQM